MVDGAPAAPRDEAFPGQQVPGRADGGPRDVRMAGPQPVEQLAGAPARMVAARVADEPRHLGSDAMWTVMRGATAIAQRLAASFLEAGQPLVAGLPADPVAGAPLRHRVPAAVPLAHEPFALLHGCCLQPGHRPTSCWSPSVKVSPMLPASGVTHVPGLYRRERLTSKWSRCASRPVRLMSLRRAAHFERWADEPV